MTVFSDYVTENHAIAILEAFEVSFDEGIGPEGQAVDDILQELARRFPVLTKSYHNVCGEIRVVEQPK